MMTDRIDTVTTLHVLMHPRALHILKSQVLDLLDAGVRHIELDFSDAGYVGTDGLGLLVSLCNRAEKTRSQITLTHVSDELRVLICIAKLDQIFHLAPAAPETTHA